MVVMFGSIQTTVTVFPNFTVRPYLIGVAAVPGGYKDASYLYKVDILKQNQKDRH
jgi:hypothetical protein